MIRINWPIQTFVFLMSMGFYLNSSGQGCTITPQSQCTSVNAVGGVCSSQTIFCIGDSVGFENRTVTTIDSSFICWGDGTVEGFSGPASSICRKHFYNFPPDSCVGGDGQIPITITLGVLKRCAAGMSYHGIQTGIAIKFRPKAVFTLSPGNVCVYEPVTFSNSSCPNSLTPTYLWNFGDGTTSTLQNPPSHQYTSSGNYTVTLTISNSCGSATTSQTVLVRPATTVSPVITLANTCAPGNFIPDVNSHNATGFLWSFTTGTGTIILPIDSQPYFTLNNAGPYGIHLQATGCCSAPTSDCTWDTTLTLYNGPTTSVSPIPDACGNTTLNPLNYFNISGGTVNSYSWTFPGGSPSSSSSANPGNITYSTYGTYIVTLVMNTPCGLKTLADTFSVLRPTIVRPNLILPTTCAPVALTTTVHSQNATGFNWSAVGGSSVITLPTDSQPSISLNTPGTYTIQLQAQGCCSAPTSDCTWDTTVTVFSGPTITKTPIPDFCGSGNFNPLNYFNIAGGTINSYSWTFPGGSPSTSTSSNPGNVSYNSTGTYIVSLLINTPCGPQTIVDTFSVLRPTTILPNIALLSTCPPTTFVPDVNSHNSTGFNWTVVGGSSTVTLPTDSQPSISINAAGNYTISVAAQGCCTDPASDCTWDTTVTVFQTINLNKTPVNDFCGSATINPGNIISASGNITTYSWAFPGGSPSSSSSASPGQISYPNPGTFIFSLTVTGPCGTKSLSDTFIVAPPTRVSPVSNLPGICTPVNFNPTVHSLNANGFQWSVISGLATITLPTDSQPAINVITAGAVTIGLNATGCCTDPQSDCSWDTTFTLFEGPSISISPFPQFCDTARFNPVTFFSLGGAISTYSWSFPGGTPATSTVANPGQIYFANPGQYPISLTLTGSCGTLTKSDTLFIGAPTSLNIIPSTLFGCDSLTIFFANSSPVNQTYIWSSTGGAFVNGTSTTSNEPYIFFNAPGAYAVNVEAFSAGCPSLPGNFVLNIGEAPNLNFTQSSPDICDTVFYAFSDYFNLTPAISDSGYAWTLLLNGAQIFNNNSSNPPPYQVSVYGTYIATASAWNACDTILLTDTFTLSPPPTLILPQDTSICTGTPPLNLNATPSGGIWTWNSNVLAGQFNPNATTSQSNHITYSYGQLTCAVTDSFLVNVFGADIDAGSDTGVCKNSGTLTFIGSPTGGYWNGTGIIDSLVATYNAFGNLTGIDTLIYVLQEPTLGCLIRDSIFVTVYSPTPGSINLPDSVCINQLLTYSNTQPNTSATWEFGDSSAPVSSNNTTHTYTIAGNYTINLYITNQYGCIDTISRAIEVAEPPNAIFSLDTIRGCAVLPITIQNLSNYYGATVYAWDYGDGQADTTYNPGTIYFDQGPGDSTIYHIHLTASNGCGVATYEDSITVYPIPVVDFGVNYTDSCSPATINFANTTTGRPQNYFWYINGVFISNDSTLATQVFTTDSLDSTYYVTLITTNFCGSDTLTKPVLIHPNTVRAFFNTDIVYGCRPLNVTFTSYVAPNATIQWNFGDGNTGFGNIISHVFDTAGTFTVWQYVDNYCGFDSISQTIQVLPQPDLSFTMDSVNCGNEPVQFSNTSDSLLGVVWNYGDGSPWDSSAFTPSHSYFSPGTYNVTMIGVAASTGCRDTLTLPANVVSYPYSSFVFNNNDGCAPFTLELQSTSTGANYYVWDLGNGDTLTGAAVNYTYFQQGTYSVSLTSIDNNGCLDVEYLNPILVYPVPNSDFVFTQNQPCILPSTIEFINTSTGATNYNWIFENNITTTQQDPILNFNDPEIFEATLIAISNFGCRDTIEKTIKVYDRPNADFEIDDFLACVNQPITFINNSTNANTYYWDFEGLLPSTEINPTISYSNSGTYNIGLFINNDSVCFDSTQLNFPIQINPIPTSGFTWQAITDTSVSNNGIFQFTDQSNGANQWVWNFSDGSRDSVQSPIHRFYTNGNITIEQIVYNQFGCPDTSEQNIFIDYFGTLFIPNAFSPDAGNEETSYFIPKGAGLSEFLIEVYSPYGELVWSSTKLINGQPVEKWDGKYKDSPVPQGAYTWKVRAIFENGQVWQGMQYKAGEKLKSVGSVVVLR